MPCKAMMKLSVRNGGMLLCGWLPPTTEIAFGFMVTLLAPLAAYTNKGVFPSFDSPHTLPAGEFEPPAVEACAVWAWIGIWLADKVT